MSGPHPKPTIPFIIPIFLPHTGCPHRCVFCDQAAITGQARPLPPIDQIRHDIRQFLTYPGNLRDTVQISFYGGNFLGLPEKTVRRLLDLATEFIAADRVHSIRFSTRPDTIDSRRLDWLSGYQVATIEIGAQSMDDNVLLESNRGHRAADTKKTMARLKRGGYETGLQMMIGLPGDNAAGALETGRQIVALAPDFVRIYPALVLAGSALADLLAAGNYRPLALDSAVDVTARLFKLFANNRIPVIRMGLQSSAALDRNHTVLAGPYHPAFGQLVMSKLFFDSVRHELDALGPAQRSISIAVHPRSVSNLRGQKNSNLTALKSLFSLDTIKITAQPDLGETEVVVNTGAPVSILNGAGSP